MTFLKFIMCAGEKNQCRNQTSWLKNSAVDFHTEKIYLVGIEKLPTFW
jgi:hypothetical protein